MSEPSKANPSQQKVPGWIAVAIVVVAVGGLGWFGWHQMNGSGPAVGERIELAPQPGFSGGNRSLTQDAMRALNNLGRGRRTPATAPTTKPSI